VTKLLRTFLLAAALAACDGAADSNSDSTDSGNSDSNSSDSNNSDSGNSSSDPVTSSAVLALEGDATRGEEVFSTNCQDCHSVSRASGWVKRNKSGSLREILSGNSEMPAFGEILTAQEIADLLAYLEG